MTPDVLELLVGMVAVIGLFSTVMVGMKMRFSHNLRMREMPTGENERLTEAVEQLQDEVRLMREEFTELHERVDFAERLLARGKSPDEARERVSTPT